jgi:hypothetical protein
MIKLPIDAWPTDDNVGISIAMPDHLRADLAAIAHLICENSRRATDKGLVHRLARSLGEYDPNEAMSTDDGTGEDPVTYFSSRHAWLTLLVTLSVMSGIVKEGRALTGAQSERFYSFNDRMFSELNRAFPELYELMVSAAGALVGMADQELDITTRCLQAKLMDAPVEARPKHLLAAFKTLSYAKKQIYVDLVGAWIND